MKDRVRDYFDAEAIEYSSASNTGLWAWVRQREARVIMNQLAPRPDERILDAGCGSGYYTELLMRAGARVTASDLSPGMVDQVRKRLGVKAMVADLCEDRFEPKYDKVLCAGALEFVPNPDAAIRNLVGALDEEVGGTLVIHVPRLSMAGKIYRRFHKRHGFTVNLFSEEDLRRLLCNVGGLTIDTLQTVTFNFVVAATRTRSS